MEILQANHICKQMSPYPLAISDIQVNMKEKQVPGHTQCLQFDCAVTDVRLLLSRPPGYLV